VGLSSKSILVVTGVTDTTSVLHMTDVLTY